MFRIVSIVLTFLTVAVALPLRTHGQQPSTPSAAAIAAAYETKVGALQEDFVREVNQTVRGATSQLAGLNHKDHARIGTIHKTQRSQITKLEAAYRKTLADASKSAEEQLRSVQDRESVRRAHDKIKDKAKEVWDGSETIKFNGWKAIDDASKAADERGRKHRGKK